MALEPLPILSLDAMTTAELDYATNAVATLLRLKEYLGSVYRQTLEKLDADLREQHTVRAALRAAPLFSVYDTDPPAA